jgi:hypothetical protein
LDTRLAMLQPRTRCFVRDWVSELLAPLMMCTNLFVGRWVCLCLCLAQPWREDSEEADDHGAREQPRERSTWLAMNLTTHCLYLCVYYGITESRRDLYLPAQWSLVSHTNACIYILYGHGILIQHVVCIGKPNFVCVTILWKSRVIPLGMVTLFDTIHVLLFEF